MQSDLTLEELGGISLIHPCWNDEERLELQFKEWERWSERVCRNVDITLIDDHSDAPVTFSEDKLAVLREKGISISIYRIIDDLKWNTPGALNLGFTMAPKDWILTMDSDCFFDAENMEKLLDFKPRDDRLHKFNRKRFGTTEADNWLNNTRHLPCTILLYRDIFTTLNGFDEDFTGERTGGYGFFDTDFDYRANTMGFPMDIVEGVVAGEWLPSVSGPPVFPGITRGESGHEKFHRINRKLCRQKQMGKVPQGMEILRFEWEKTL